MPLLVHLIDQPLPICINFQFYVHLHNLITTSNGKYEREHYSRGHGRRLMFKVLCVWIPAPGGRWIFHHMDLFFYRLFVKTGDDSFRKSGINQINTLNKEKRRADSNPELQEAKDGSPSMGDPPHMIMYFSFFVKCFY